MAESANPTGGGLIMPRQLTRPRKMAAAALGVVMRLLMKTWRVHWKEDSGRAMTAGPVIFSFWHNRLIQALAANKRGVQSRWPSLGTCALISASRDGAFLSRLVEPFGVVPIRGSTSRRGPQALLEATTWLEKNHNIAITPDGPRGPAYQVQDGIIQLAQITGRPIIPLSTYVRPKIRLRSWDRFQIPLPFSRCEMRYGPPVLVPREASEGEREQLRRALEKSMLDMTTD